MGIYDRDYMKRPPDDHRRRSSSPRRQPHGSEQSLLERLESISETLFSKHRKLLIGILAGLIGLSLISFIALKLS